MFELLCSDPAIAIGDLFRAGDFKALTVFDGLDELGGFDQRVVGAGIEPGITTAHDFNVELVLLEVDLVDGGDFQFTTSRGLDRFGDVDDLVVVEVETGDGITALRLSGLLFDGEGFAVGVEFDNAVTFGVSDVISKDGGATGLGIGPLE